MMFFDLPSFLFVALSALAAAMSAGFGREAWPRISAVILPVGCLGMCIGLVQMLSQMDDPAHFWPAFFVATLTLIYASLLKIGIQVMIPQQKGLLPSAPKGQMGHGALGIFAMVILSGMTFGGPLFSFIDLSSIVCLGLVIGLIAVLPGTVKRVGLLPSLIFV